MLEIIRNWTYTDKTGSLNTQEDCGRFGEVFNAGGGLDDLVAVSRAIEYERTCRRVEEFVQQLSDQFFAQVPERQHAGLYVHERGRVKTILTEIGEVRLRNDVYKYRGEDGRWKYVSPILRRLDIMPHQRVSNTFSESLVTNAMDRSYRKSGRETGTIPVSGQTVWRHIRKISVCPLLVSESPRQVEALDLYIDEEHLGIQKDANGKKRGMVPLCVLSEGRYEECAGRNRLIERRCFVSEDLSGVTLMNIVEGYIFANYDLHVLKEVRVHGDGASWICRSLDGFQQAVHIMDGFHAERALRRTIRCLRGDDASAFRSALKLAKKYICEGNKNLAECLLQTIIWSEPDESARKRAQKELQYIMNHWDAIVLRYKGTAPGSCTLCAGYSYVHKNAPK